MDATTHRSGDGGFALIEVVVSAALLAIAALAILGGIDGASRSAARERSRAVAATLADQDQERMRAMSTDALTDYHPAARTVTVNDVTYSVTSSSDWIRDDSGGTTSCTNDSKQVDYLKITSTVQGNVIGTQTKPVTLTSLVAPPISKAEGTLAVQVNNRDNAGLAGIPVSLTPKSGGISQSQPTNSVGCAIFQHLPVDTYTVTLTSPTANVDTFGQNPSKKGVDVLNGTVQVTTMKWDQAAAVPWTVQTANPLGGPAIPNSVAPKVSAVNGEEKTLFRTFSGSPATQLFPFVTPYAFFTGSCPQENPTVAGAGSDYYSSHLGQVATSRGATSPLLTIFQPPVGMKLTDGSSGLTDDKVAVRATLQPKAGDDPPCTETVTLHTASVPGKGKGNGYLSQSSSRYDPGLPFGTWDICASRTTSSGKLYAFRTVVNANPDATSVPPDVPVTMSSLPAGQLAECP